MGTCGGGVLFGGQIPGDQLAKPECRAKEYAQRCKRRAERQRRKGRYPLTDTATNRKHCACAHHCGPADLAAQLSRILAGLPSEMPFRV